MTIDVTKEDLYEAEHKVGTTEHEELLTFRYAYYQCIQTMQEAVEVLGDEQVTNKMREVIAKCPLKV